MLPLLLALLSPALAQSGEDLEVEVVSASEAPRAVVPTVLFVHGMHMQGASWGPWETWFQEHGYDTVAPSWPFREGIPSVLRESPPPGLTGLTLDDVVAHYARVIEGLDEEPLLVGHSMGGLVVQMLLAQGHGRAGVAIDSAPPKGVSTLKFSFLKSTLRFLGNDDEPIVPTEKWFAYAMANNLPDSERPAAFDAYMVPESRRVAKAPTKKTTVIDWEAARPPLLMIGGGDDHIIPAGLNRRNADKYGEAAPTEFVELEGRTHWILLEPGWEEVAETTEAFLRQHVAE